MSKTLSRHWAKLVGATGILIGLVCCSSSGKCPLSPDGKSEPSCPDGEATAAGQDGVPESRDDRLGPDTEGNCYAIKPTHFRFDPVQSLTREQMGLPDARDVSAVTLSPDGKHLYVTSWVTKAPLVAISVFAIDPTTGEISPVQTLTSWEDATTEPVDDPPVDPPSLLRISNDGESAYAVGNGEAALVLCDRNVETGKLKYSTVIPRTQLEWPESMWAMAIAESPDSSFLHLGTNPVPQKMNARITTLRGVEGQPPYEFVSHLDQFHGQGFAHILAMAFRPDGQYLVAYVDCGRLIVFGIDPATDEFMPLTEVPYSANCAGKFTAGLHFAPDGTRFILASSTAPAQVFEFVLHPDMPFDPYPSVKPLHSYTEHALELSHCGGPVWGSALSPDGLSLVLRMQYQAQGQYAATTAATYWNSETAALHFESVWTGHEDCAVPDGPLPVLNPGDTAAFSPDGRFVYIGQMDCWDPPSDEINAPLLEVYERVPLL